MPNTLAG